MKKLLPTLELSGVKNFQEHNIPLKEHGQNKVKKYGQKQKIYFESQLTTHVPNFKNWLSNSINRFVYIAAVVAMLTIRFKPMELIQV